MQRRFGVERYEDVLAAADGDDRDAEAVAHIELHKGLTYPGRGDQCFIDAVFIGKVKVIDDAARNEGTGKAYTGFVFRQNHFVRAGLF